jgi:hypothetical protein
VTSSAVLYIFATWVIEECEQQFNRIISNPTIAVNLIFSFSILLIVRIIKKSKETITLKSELVVIRLPSLCKNIVGWDFQLKK